MQTHKMTKYYKIDWYNFENKNPTIACGGGGSEVTGLYADFFSCISPLCCSTINTFTFQQKNLMLTKTFLNSPVFFYY